MRAFSLTAQIFLLFLLSNNVDSFDRSKRYYSLISNVHKYYGTSCVFIVHKHEKNLVDLGRIEEMMWLFSNESTLASAVEFEGFNYTMSHYENRVVRPLLVVVMTDLEIVVKFSNLTNGFDMSRTCWLLLFDDRVYNQTVAANARKNIFNLDFNSEMLVARSGHKNIQELYWLDKKLKTVDLAVWEPDTLKFTLKNDMSLYERRSGLDQSEIRVATLDNPSQASFSNHTTVGGLIGAILVELSTAANFSVNYVTPDEKTYGTWNEERQNWSGMIQTLVSKKATIAAGEFTITTTRMRAVDFTLPLVSTSTKLYIRKPESGIDWSSYWKALAPGIWIMIQLLILITTILLSLMVVVRESRISIDIFTQYFLYVFGIYCQQGVPDFPTDSPSRIAFFSIFLSALIVSAAYSAALISFLTVADATLPFTTLEEFVQDPTYRLLVYRDGAEYEMLQASNDSTLMKMFGKIIAREELPLTITEAFNRICQDKLAFFLPGALVATMRGSIPCKVVEIDSKRSVCLAMALSKGNPFNGLINFHVQKFRDHGILNRLKHDFTAGASPSVSTHSEATLWGVMPIIAILAVGILMAFIVLFLEILYFERQYRVSKINDKIDVRRTSRSDDIMRIQLRHRTNYPKVSPNFYH